MSKGTLQQYDLHFQSFKTFLSSVFRVNWKNATTDHVTDYVTYLQDTTSLAPATIKSRVSAIAFQYKTRLNADPTKSFATEILLNNLEKQAQSRKRLPIDKKLLKKLLLTLYQYNSIYLHHAFYLMYNLMYLLALRVSELLAYSKKFDHALRFNDFYINNNKVTITVRSGKHNSSPTKYEFRCTNRFFWHFQEFVRLRGNKTGPFFCFKDQQPFSRTFFTEKLKEDLCSLELNARDYNTHSFRVGRTSDLALEGASDRQIALMGRWKSDAFREYVRPSRIYLDPVYF